MNKFSNYYSTYTEKLTAVLASVDRRQLDLFSEKFFEVWCDRSNIFLIGNGGSAGNSIHLANDFVYGAANPKMGGGARVVSLAANPSVLTCLGNDLGYREIFSAQLEVYATRGDLLVVLSGSGNSPNVIEAIKVAKKLDVVTAAILGFNGGEVLGLVDLPLHLKVDDMQMSEDFQLIIMHAMMQYAREEAGMSCGNC